MIEDKDLKIKIAESPKEEIWQTIKENTEKRIDQSEIQIEVDKHLLEFIKTKIKVNSNA